MTELPTGTVTFLFSDIEGSTRLLQQLGDRWNDVVAAHNRIMRAAFEEAGGREVDRQGDAFFAVFGRARNALAAAVTAQRALAEESWPDGAQVRVRMGIHTGEPSLGDEGYLGLDVVRAARICALARGGQVLVSESAGVLARGDLGELELRDAGRHQLKDIDEPERLYVVAGPGLVADALVPAPGDAELAVAGREVALAHRALERLHELELGPLERLGPQIEAQVEAALRRGRVGDRLPVARETRGRLDALGRMPLWAVVAAGAGGVAIVLALGVLLVLLVWLVNSLL